MLLSFFPFLHGKWGAECFETDGVYGALMSHAWYPERIFHVALPKSIQKGGRDGIMLYRNLLFTYSREGRASVYRDVEEISPNIPALLHALSMNGEPEKAEQYLQSMEEDFGLTPRYIHYGSLVDAFARLQTPSNIEKAVSILMEVPIARHQWTLNAIISRSYPRKSLLTKDEKENAEKTIRVCQDLVDFLHKEKFHFAVIASTYWNLKKEGLKWRPNVEKKSGEK